MLKKIYSFIGIKKQMVALDISNIKNGGINNLVEKFA